MTNHAGRSNDNNRHHGDNKANNDNTDNQDTRDLRAALQMAVCQIIVKQDRINRTRTTSEAIRALTELIYQYVTNRLVPDLYQFSNHANRKSTIAVDDVALVLRKLPHLQKQLMENLDNKRVSPSKESSSTSTKRRSSTFAQSRQETAKSIATNSINTSRQNRSVNELLSSSDDDDGSSIEINSTNKESSHSMAAPRARRAPSTTAKQESSSTTILNLKRPPTYSQTKRKVEELLNDSSSEDELPDFMKPKRKAIATNKQADLLSDSPLMPPPKPRTSPKQTKVRHQSQVMEILNSYSSDSGLSHHSEEEPDIRTNNNGGD